MTRISFSKEPAAWVGLLTSVLMVLADFGLHLTHDQWAHLIDLVPAVMAIVAVRPLVTPNNSVPAPAVAALPPGPAPITPDAVLAAVRAAEQNSYDAQQAETALKTAIAEAVRPIQTPPIAPSPVAQILEATGQQPSS